MAAEADPAAARRPVAAKAIVNSFMALLLEIDEGKLLAGRAHFSNEFAATFRYSSITIK